MERLSSRQRGLEVLTIQPPGNKGFGVERRIDVLAIGYEVIGFIGQGTHIARRHIQQVIVIPETIRQATSMGQTLFDKHDAQGVWLTDAKQVDRGKRAAESGANNYDRAFF